MVDWNKLVSLEGEQSRGLETLAYRVASVLHAEDGPLVRVDDRGGGDGVEFYLVLPSREEWGWQTKLFLPGHRLNAGGRKTQIKRSLERAIAIHPNLTRWTLCTPMDLTTEERRWFTETLRRSIPRNRQVELALWDGAFIVNHLTQPRFEGARRFFFGELELGLDWFRNRFAAHEALIGAKVIPVLHVSSHVDEAIGVMLADEAAVASIDKQLAEVDGLLEEQAAAIAALACADTPGAEWHEARDSAVAAARATAEALEAARGLAATAIARLRQGRKDVLDGFDLRAALRGAHAAENEYERLLGEIVRGEALGNPDCNEATRDQIRSLLMHPHSAGWRIQHALAGVQSDLEVTARPALHVLGTAGVGKTHLAFSLCRNRLDRGLPALLVPAKRIATAEPLEAQLRDEFDVPPAYSWADFLGALDAAAAAHRTRIPIVVDGLNEATLRGRLSQVWERDLPGLVDQISRYPRLALVTTCRTSYADAIWPEKRPDAVVELYGFDDEDVEEAVARYFAHYRITGDLTLASLAEFRLPLYLKLFCETTNPTREREVTAYVGQESIFGVFDRYLTARDAAVADRLNRPRAARIVPTALAALADYLWGNRARDVPVAEAYRLVDKCPPEEVDLTQSVVQALLDEGLFVARDWRPDGEVVAFTYDLLGGYVVASALLDRHRDALPAFVNDEGTSALLFDSDWRTRHPLADDVGRSLAALLPARASGRYLHELTDDEGAFQLSIAALFEISPALVTGSAVDLVARLFDHPDNRRGLLDLAMPAAAHVDHPLNAAFWSDRLGPLATAERDLAWSEHVREHQALYEATVARFEAACRDAELSELGERRAHLLAPLLRWCLTSSVRPLRDLATRTLYRYGRRWPRRLLDLALASLPVGDPYVPERMLAALYGVAMAGRLGLPDPGFRAEVLPAAGRALYDAMFAAGAPHATTHLLARDYARLTIEVALLHRPDLLGAEERARIRPPFRDGGNRAWGREPDRNRGAYRGGNHPIDFLDDNPLEALHIASKHHAGSPEYREGEENLWWRIYGLGYSLDRFGHLDIEIGYLDRGLGGGRYVRRADGYGRKYSRIATLELAGLRDDRGLMERAWRGPGERLSLVDIDPSFPEPPPDRAVVRDDFLGDRAVPLRDWILGGDAPDLAPYLVVDELDGEPGPWVLLDGWVNQEELASHRNVFAFPRGLLVPAGEADRVVVLLEGQDVANRWLPEVPHDVYRFGDEVPWCETYPANGPADLAFEVGTETRAETEERWVRTRDGAEVDVDGERLLRRLGLLNDGEGCGDADDEDVELREVAVEREVPVLETHRATVAVRDDHWEDYHSVANPGRAVATPTREVAGRLGLVARPQTPDLFEPSGRRASVTLESGDPWHSVQRLAYLRRDLLDRYLAEAGEALVWAVWGERGVAAKALSDHLPEVAFEPTYKTFQRIARYEPADPD